MTDEKLKELVEEGVVGFHSYPSNSIGGQVVGLRVTGVRYWFPKDTKNPDIDIKISSRRSQWQNNELAKELFKLAMEEL